MQVVVSPAKKLDWTERDLEMTAPQFHDNATALVNIARSLSVSDLMKLMHISEDLAKLNYDRFQNFLHQPSIDTLRPALFAFAGDTYRGLEANSLDEEEINWAQDHLRILSGLYGILKPLDAIQPYRLEMGSRLQNPRGKNLYDYWGTKVSEALNFQAQEINNQILVNCASQEYFGAVDLDTLRIKVLTPIFMENKSGTPKIVSFHAKRARGAMARYIIQNRIIDETGILDFNSGGYVYQPSLSETNKPVFLRET